MMNAKIQNFSFLKHRIFYERIILYLLKEDVYYPSKLCFVLNNLGLVGRINFDGTE